MARGVSVPVRRALDLWLSKIAHLSLPDDGLRGQITLGFEMWLVLIVSSRDRPGRRFPLALLCPFADDDHAAAENWCDAALVTYRQNADTNADRLFAALPPAPAEDGKSQAAEGLWVSGGSPAPLDHIISQLSSD